MTASTTLESFPSRSDDDVSLEVDALEATVKDELLAIRTADDENGDEEQSVM